MVFASEGTSVVAETISQLLAKLDQVLSENCASPSFSRLWGWSMIVKMSIYQSRN